MVNYLIAFIDSKLIIARNSWMLASLIITIIIIIINIVVLHKYVWRNFFSGQMTIYEHHGTHVIVIQQIQNFCEM